MAWTFLKFSDPLWAMNKNSLDEDDDGGERESIADATEIRQKMEDEKTKRCKKKRKTLLTQATHTTKLSCAASAVNSQSTVSSRIDNWPPEIGKKLRGKK